MGEPAKRSRSWALQKTNNEPEHKKKRNKKPKKQKTKKHKIAHPKGGSSGRELGLVIVFFLLFFWLLVFLVFGFWFCLAISEKPTANQKTRNQKTKKKKKIAHPKGGSSGRELGLVIVFFLLFFWLLVFLVFGFWFCLAIAEKPSRNCQWLQNAVKNRTPRVSPSGFFPPLRMVLQIQAQLQVRPNFRWILSQCHPLGRTFRSQCKPWFRLELTSCAAGVGESATLGSLYWVYKEGFDWMLKGTLKSVEHLLNHHVDSFSSVKPKFLLYTTVYPNFQTQLHMWRVKELQPGTQSPTHKRQCSRASS